MNILFFDTETTGLPDWNGALDAPYQPYLTQVAAILTDEDGTERCGINMIVNSGVPIPKAASDVHGITDDVARRYGATPRTALTALRGLARQADRVVAHNMRFDAMLVDIATEREGWPPHVIIGLQDWRFCTMETCSPLINLPPTERMIAAGFNKPKPPKLGEAYRHFLGKELEGAHDALVDVRACKDVYFALKSAGAI